ncbi:hypothetical protein NDU88_005488 [Pleurodeles waltl]|uniref:Uncharacterized protein n=1 Tax=Pleurodeles waltl TaxID=8319 RepID=A0AAV7SLS0_PLEWA|nr:hypothetical protein NDU88_005488 [Pleurodeles waltl]
MPGTGRETLGSHRQEWQRPPRPCGGRRGTTQGVGSHCWAPLPPEGADLPGHRGECSRCERGQRQPLEEPRGRKGQ